MRPVLKSYVGVGTSDEGVFFEAGQRSFELKDPRLFPLVSRLLGTLDGRRTVEEISGALPDNLRPLFRTLVTELDRNAMLQKVPANIAEAIPAALAERYRATIAFLLDESAAGAEHFLDWRNRPIVVGGTGHSHRALLRGLIGSGAGNLLLVGLAAPSLLEMLGAHAADDLDITWRQIASVAEAPAGARFIYAADNLSDPHVEEALRAWPEVLAGGVYRGRGVVGPCGDPAIWPTLSPVESAVPFPASSLAVIGALLSFEALKAMIYAERAAPNEPRWDKANLFTVSATADIAVHPVMSPTAPLGAAAPSSVVQPQVPATPPVRSALERPFDPATGPFAWQEPEGREFPLPRRAILVRHPDGRQEMVDQWAMTPQQIDLRTICKAAAALAGDDMLAAPDYATWQSLAQANAIVGSERFQHADTFDIDLADETDPALQMLIRLGRLYGEAMPIVRIACLPDACAFLAEAEVAGQIGRAADCSAAAALIEALGEAISAQQRPVGAPHPQRHGPLPASRGITRKLSSLDSLADQNPDVNLVQEIVAPAALAGTGIVVGRMVVKP